MQETWVQSPGREDPLEKGPATHSSNSVWRTPGTKESGGLQSMGWQRVGYNWARTHTKSWTKRRRKASSNEVPCLMNPPSWMGQSFKPAAALFFCITHLESTLHSHFTHFSWSTFSAVSWNLTSIPSFVVVTHSRPSLWPCTPQHVTLPVLHHLPKLAQLMSIEKVMPSIHLILCHPLLLPPSIFPSIRIFSNESTLCIRHSKYWSFSLSISLSNDYLGLITFSIDWLDLLAVQGTLKCLLQHHSPKASILSCSAFFMLQLWHPYMPTVKTIALTLCQLCWQSYILAF